MSAKLTITVGLPASGKSTWAETVRVNNPDGVRVVCRDDIREFLHANFEQGDERVVVAVRDTAIRGFLDKGYHVVSADTNLDAKTRKRLRSIADYAGADFEIQDFRDVPLEVCLTRNTERHERGDLKVPNTAIVDMHSRFVA